MHIFDLKVAVSWPRLFMHFKALPEARVPADQLDEVPLARADGLVFGELGHSELFHGLFEQLLPGFLHFINNYTLKKSIVCVTCGGSLYLHSRCGFGSL